MPKPKARNRKKAAACAILSSKLAMLFKNKRLRNRQKPPRLVPA